MQSELIADCVHCGFCLPTCPTYSLWHEEMDSPRGRIYLMQGLVDGSISLSDTVVEHFDRCLGCMACVTACPSGVKYDPLIERARDLLESRADVCEDVRRRFAAVLVDEVQDTSRLQQRIGDPVRPASALSAVGDVKQAS